LGKKHRVDGREVYVKDPQCHGASRPVDF